MMLVVLCWLTMNGMVVCQWECHVGSGDRLDPRDAGPFLIPFASLSITRKSAGFRRS